MTREMVVQIGGLVVGLALLVGAPALVRLLSAYRAREMLAVPIAREMAVPTAITRLDVIYAVAMIVGILAKEIWDNINETGTVKVQLPRIIAALLVSPIVYAAVYSHLAKDELSLLGLAIAFQNGFFWQAVFRTAQGAHIQQPVQQGLSLFRLVG